MQTENRSAGNGTESRGDSLRRLGSDARWAWKDHLLWWFVARELGQFGVGPLSSRFLRRCPESYSAGVD